MCTTATALLLGDQSESAATLHTSLRAVSKAGRSISDHAFSLLALQAPVASELRAVVATIHIVGNIDRWQVWRPMSGGWHCGKVPE
ncbi:phosphate transport system protein phoU-like protein [Mycobacteroides abscessus]|nr:phosphate transport system protein phoU-like protein [Mycobacteroides abscessus]